ncbi:hypothetical protein [Microcystis phage MJing1]|nr:hypothetical protein [Microcystis phage MJing1]
MTQTLTKAQQMAIDALPEDGSVAVVSDTDAFILRALPSMARVEEAPPYENPHASIGVGVFHRPTRTYRACLLAPGVAARGRTPAHVNCSVTVYTEIAAERERQIAIGRHAAHDDQHANGELIDPHSNDYWGAVPRLRSTSRISQFHPSYRKKLVQSAALIVAELERLNRLGARGRVAQEAPR